MSPLKFKIANYAILAFYIVFCILTILWMQTDMRPSVVYDENSIRAYNAMLSMISLILGIGLIVIGRRVLFGRKVKVETGKDLRI